MKFPLPQDTALPLLEQLMPGVARLLEKGRFNEERRIAICVMDDILEHSPAGTVKYMAQVGGGRWLQPRRPQRGWA